MAVTLPDQTHSCVSILQWHWEETRFSNNFFWTHRKKFWTNSSILSAPLFWTSLSLKFFLRKFFYQNWHYNLKISVLTTLPESFSWKFEIFSFDVQNSFRLNLENTCNFFISSTSFSSMKCFSGHTINKFDNPNGKQSPEKKNTLSTDFAEVTSFRSYGLRSPEFCTETTTILCWTSK